MQIGCTPMHPVTLTAITIELIMLGAQGALYLQRPHDRTRLGYVILLLLLILFNTANGLFPSPAYDMPEYVQHIIVNTFGFMIVSYFPFYFYRVLGLEKLRFLAVYGVPLFLVVPYLVFFVVGLSVHEDVAFTHRYGYIAPTIYTVALLIGTVRAIRFAYREHRNRQLYVEETAAYAAIMPWAFLAPVVYFQWGQLTETLFTNLGFLALSIFLLYRSIRWELAEKRELEGLREMGIAHSPYFDENCVHYGLSEREKEVAQLVRKGLRNKDIAGMLSIAEGTVKRHIENMFHKTGAGTRMELVHILVHLRADTRT
ncbi:hypothetical protein CHU00_06650 [Sphingobacterium cellulitidis]|uniref:helix-turn-helix transcriptional regulator n=1 Tax=Sphingobacterium cellulitidis TaxID=1768011 RepID=UPI000B93D7E2|nr:helix-turn-helix transcriptional regulator [Sphingobacterium cellulitidis]OYD46364.1 hypothetical protein CHU00_06650 [Sphingobacterium cellulitidis]